MSGLELVEGDRQMMGVVLKLIADLPALLPDSQIFSHQEVSFRLGPGGPSWKLSFPVFREDIVELASRMEVISPDKRWGWTLREMESDLLRH